MLVLVACALAGACRESRPHTRATARVLEEISALLDRPDPVERRELVERILEDGRLPVGVLDESVVGIGLTQDDAIRTGRPVGVIVRNPEPDLRVAGLRLLVGGAKAEYPLTVFVDGGGEVREFVFESERSLHVRLGEVPPGGAELYILWADRRWGPRLREPQERLRRLWAEQALTIQLEGLRERRDLSEWRRVAERVASGEVDGAVPLAGKSLLVVGSHADLWTRGSSPVGLLAVNSSDDPFVPSVRVSGRRPAATSPVSVFIDDGLDQSEHSLVLRGWTRLPLPVVPSHSKRLFLLWTDNSWSPGAGDSRTLGVRLAPSRRGRKR